MNNQNNFQRADIKVPNRSRHRMGNSHISTVGFGSLIPIYYEPLIPGDTVYYNPKIFIRTPAAQTATFGQVRVTQASFFVPTRLLWDDWTSFITGGLNSREFFQKPYVTYRDFSYLSFMEGPSDTTKPLSLLDDGMLQSLEGNQVFPLFSRGAYSDLQTNFGINVFAGLTHNPAIGTSNVRLTGIQNEPLDILPFRAYQKIWWDWFRDSVLIPEALKNDYLQTDGLYQDFHWTNLYQAQSQDDVTRWLEDNFTVLNQFRTRQISYRKDYFTTAKTDPQMGAAALVPVDVASAALNPSLGTTGTAAAIGLSTAGNVGKIGAGTYPGVSSLTGQTTSVLGQFQIEVFRTMNALQRYSEKNMIVGTRPINLFLARYGYAPSAERYDMAELVAGDDRYLDWVQVTSTADTAEGDSGASLADVSSYGRLFFNGDRQTYTAHEHGFFISLLAIQPVVGYCDGIDKRWQMFDKEDYFTEEYENNGFEAIANKEIFASGYDTNAPGGDSYDEMPPTTPDVKWNQAFGFQERYAFWKWHRDVLAGDFVRFNTSLGGDAFHTFRRFGRIPALNPDFVNVYAKSYGNNWNRLFVDTNTDYNPFILDIDNENNMVRPMKGFAEPSLENIFTSGGRSIDLPYGGVRM